MKGTSRTLQITIDDTVATRKYFRDITKITIGINRTKVH